MQLLRRAATEIVSTALCLSALIGCQGDDSLDLAAEDAEIAEQWVDQAETPAAGSTGDCGDRLQPGQERNCRFAGRSYTIRAGRTMKTDAPVALVIDLPSTTSTPAQILGKERFCFLGLCWNSIGSGWAAESDTPDGGFIVVVPDRSSLMLGDEQTFLRQLVSEIRRVADVDLGKVYLTGASDAANTALEIGCAQSDFFAGVSPNSGSTSGCRNLRRPLPVIAFSTRADITYSTNATSAENVARANGCRGEASLAHVRPQPRDAVCRTANGDPRARIVPCSDVTSARIEPTECRVWTGCRTTPTWCSRRRAGQLARPAEHAGGCPRSLRERQPAQHAVGRLALLQAVPLSTRAERGARLPHTRRGPFEARAVCAFAAGVCATRGSVRAIRPRVASREPTAEGSRQWRGKSNRRRSVASTTRSLRPHCAWRSSPSTRRPSAIRRSRSTTEPARATWPARGSASWSGRAMPSGTFGR